MKERTITVYHVELLDPQEGERQHSYFGSLAAVFDTYPKRCTGRPSVTSPSKERRLIMPPF